MEVYFYFYIKRITLLLSSLCDAIFPNAAGSMAENIINGWKTKIIIIHSPQNYAASNQPVSLLPSITL
jgi:hypothetical protein